MIVFVLIIILLLMLFQIKRYYTLVNKYPKGPTPLPFIGNLLHIPINDTPAYFEILSKVYGPVFTIFLPLPTVILCDYTALKEAMITKGDCFAGRPQNYPESFFQYAKDQGIIFSEGPNWVDQRRMAFHILRNFGMGKDLMEKRVHDSVNDLIKFITDQCEQDYIDIKWPIQITMANIMNDLLYGYKYDIEGNEKYKTLVIYLTEAIKKIRCSKTILLMQLFNEYPKINNILKYFCGVNTDELEKLFQKVRDDVDEVIETFKHDVIEPKNFVHAYLQKCNMMEGSNINKDEIYGVVYDMWFAGMETVTTVLYWSFLFLATNQDKQRMIRKEILNVIGSNYEIEYKYKFKMPYTTAVIYESLRLGNIIPFIVTHKTTCDVDVCGVNIPKNTNIYPQVYNVMKYDEDFIESDKFIPERFLLFDLDNHAILNKNLIDKCVPFGLGKRRCLGESIAHMELFIVLVKIIQKFDIKIPSNINVEDYKPVWGAILKPKKLDFKFERIVY
uniref:Cytochrome P450 18a1 (inferred by orthology to a D. melanogaster protein) n=1 Tax=Parastrongyloides trichosuri TaxID=131310 RepID=A0A0N4ZDC8_PARTI